MEAPTFKSSGSCLMDRSALTWTLVMPKPGLQAFNAFKGFQENLRTEPAAESAIAGLAQNR